MTASQYKNIVEWTYRLHPELSDMDAWDAIKKLFNCLGVAFPQGKPSDILPVLQSNAFMGWTPCSREDACEFANMGIPAIRMDEKEIILITPYAQTKALTDLRDEVVPDTAPVRAVNDVSAEDTKAHFFAYSYRRILEKKE